MSTEHLLDDEVLLRKKFNQLQQLHTIGKAARFRWRTILALSIILILLNLAAGYVITNSISVTGAVELSGVFLLEREGGSGTGFAVSDRYVLTAAHVAGDVGSIVTMSNDDGLVTDGKVVASGYSEWQNFLLDESHVRDGATPHDWALIEASQTLSSVKPLICGSIQNVAIDEDIRLVGHPAGQPLTVSRGGVSRIDDEAVYTDGGIDPGFSGGPMILSDVNRRIQEGIVIGVVVSAPEGLETVNEAVSIDIVRNACGRAGYSDIF